MLAEADPALAVRPCSCAMGHPNLTAPFVGEIILQVSRLPVNTNIELLDLLRTVLLQHLKVTEQFSFTKLTESGMND